MTSSNWNISQVTGPLWGEFTGHRWIPFTKASDALMFSLIFAWTNGWANHREAGDFRRHHAHYDVTVMEHFVNITTVILLMESHKIFCVLLHSTTAHQTDRWIKGLVVWYLIMCVQIDICYVITNQAGPIFYLWVRIASSSFSNSRGRLCVIHEPVSGAGGIHIILCLRAPYTGITTRGTRDW